MLGGRQNYVRKLPWIAFTIEATYASECNAMVLWRRYMLFPCLRATADLLMMPKEVLTDRAIRAEVVPGLSLRRICQLLNRFLPDDFAPDPLPPG